MTEKNIAKESRRKSDSSSAPRIVFKKTHLADQDSLKEAAFYERPHSGPLKGSSFTIVNPEKTAVCSFQCQGLGEISADLEAALKVKSKEIEEGIKVKEEGNIN